MARMRATERRRQLLEVAAELFAHRGYRGTTTAELARAAEITEPILYRHFENKLDLFVTLIDEVGKEVIHAWEEALNAAEKPGQRLRALLAANPATHERGRRIYRVIFQAMAEMEGEGSIAAALRQHITRLHRFVKNELNGLQKAGVVRRDESASALAWMLIDVAIGYGMLAPLGLPGQGSRARGTGIERMMRELLSR